MDEGQVSEGDWKRGQLGIHHVPYWWRSAQIFKQKERILCTAVRKARIFPRLDREGSDRRVCVAKASRARNTARLSVSEVAQSRSRSYLIARVTPLSREHPRSVTGFPAILPPSLLFAPATLDCLLFSSSPLTLDGRVVCPVIFLSCLLFIPLHCGCQLQ